MYCITPQSVLMFNGSSDYQGDVALDALYLTCSGSKPNPVPVTNGTADPVTNRTAAPVTNGTAAPYPTGDGEVRVKFGGAQVTIVPCSKFTFFNFIFLKFTFINC